MFLSAEPISPIILVVASLHEICLDVIKAQEFVKTIPPNSTQPILQPSLGNQTFS